MPRHFLKLSDLTPAELFSILDRAGELRQQHHHHQRHQPLQGRVLAMLFEKASTRTRVSFEAGMAQLGGHAIFLSPNDTQLGRGEPIEDTARVISRMVDAVMIRTHSHQRLEAFAQHSRVPVINGLSDLQHPCQLLADLQTWREHHGDLQQRKAVWIGDGNNVCNSFIDAAELLGFELRICCPAAYAPDLSAADPDRIRLITDLAAAVEQADLLVTDVWSSMGQEAETQARKQAFKDYQVTAELMKLAAKDAVFMHCLPAHRGEEVTAEVIDGPQSLVWDDAENRLHVQKALLEFLLLN